MKHQSVLIEPFPGLSRHGLVLSFLLACSAACAQDYPQMVVVDGGTFIMGDDSGEKDEKPAHSVLVSTYSLAKTETTVLQWRIFCEATGRRTPEAPWFGLLDGNPIVNISWDDAIAYCKWLSETKGRRYRLPTEAEWEFAAKGGLKSKGFSYSGSQVADTVGWLGGKTNGTMPVAQKLPNELGLYDMTGNVWEWCADWYEPNYYSMSPKENPVGPKTGMYYTLRGGAWDIGSRNSRIAYRNPLSPSSRNHNKGFRVALSH